MFLSCAALVRSEFVEKQGERQALAESEIDPRWNVIAELSLLRMLP
jgi:hypothetical protein